MKNKSRVLKQHYRNVEREVRDFRIDISENSWYKLWHTHLDWNGITSSSSKHRKNHILYYFKIFDKIEEQTKGVKREFQTWIFLDKNDGIDDAIYFNTKSPNEEFPYNLDNIEWNIEIPQILKGLLDLSKFTIGVVKDEKGEVACYIIQKKELGLTVNKR
ncbi:hypothetical protein UT300007_17320 [Clostridium sp. CTA-7]